MRITVNGIETNYDVQGEGPWLTLSHSLAADISMWDDQMADLTRHYKVLRYDTRGHGKTAAPNGPYTLDLLADDLKALLDALGIRQTHFCGLSMGGMIGQTFALKYPGVFRTLVLADTTSRYPAEGFAMWQQRIDAARANGLAGLIEPTLTRWFTEPFRTGRPDVMDRVRKMIAATPAEGYASCGDAIRRVNLTDRLKEIPTPTLVIVGDQDGGTPPAMSEEIRNAKPGAELYVIKDASHISNMEKPAAFTHVLLEFLKKH
jgi:3-oxoadipate enol-lactonase